MMAALVALAAPATAGAAPTAKAAKKKAKAPVVQKVSPLDVAVGETLTIRGKNFLRGRFKNTVVFKRDGARAVFVKADVGTKKMIALKVPASLQEFFALSAGNPQPTRFRIRVLAGRFGKKFTKNKLSPVVSAPRPPKVETPTESLPDGDCDGDGHKNKNDEDDDNDGLADGVELSLSLDPCVADTDEDGLLDKWEFDCDRDGALNRDEADDDDDLINDTRETQIGTDPCVADTDGDKVADGYEYQSAHGPQRRRAPAAERAPAVPGQEAVPERAVRRRRRRLRRRLADAAGGVRPVGLHVQRDQDRPARPRPAVLLGRRAVHALAAASPAAARRPPRADAQPRALRQAPAVPRLGGRAAGYRTVMLDDNAPWWDHAACATRTACST